MSYQIYICEGNLTADPELKYVKETPKCTFSVAINQKYGDREETIFVDVEAWDKLADTIAEYKRKGDEVLVQGRWKMDEYETDNGKRRKWYVRADTVRFIGAPREGSSSGSRRERDDDRPRRDDRRRSNDRPRRDTERTERDNYDDLPF